MRVTPYNIVRCESTSFGSMHQLVYASRHGHRRRDGRYTDRTNIFGSYIRSLSSTSASRIREARSRRKASYLHQQNSVQSVQPFSFTRATRVQICFLLRRIHEISENEMNALRTVNAVLSRGMNDLPCSE